MFSFLKKKQQSGLTAVGLYADGVCAVRVIHEPGQRPRIVKWVFETLDRGQSIDKALGSVARAFDLKRGRCTTVLGETDYQLLLTEAPDVKPEELKAALRWRVKDLIDFHINDAALDAFELPTDSTGGKVREMYAVAARNAAIQERADRLTAAGINLDIIDIPELAQRNLAALLPQDANGVALLSMQAGSGLITITRQASLYLSRALNVGFDTLRAAADPVAYFDHIVLEVQRSLDYYESHFREAPLRQLVLAPFAEEVPGFMEHLSANLGLTVSRMDLTTLVDSDSNLPPDIQARCLATLGAALRQEAKAL